MTQIHNPFKLIVRFVICFSVFWISTGISYSLIRIYQSTSGYKIRQCRKFVENKFHPDLKPQIVKLSESGATVSYFEAKPFTGFRTDKYISCKEDGVELWKFPEYKYEILFVSLLSLGGFAYITFKKTSKK